MVTDMIYENHFHNSVHESEKALLVSVWKKGVMSDHDCGNWIEQHSK